MQLDSLAITAFWQDLYDSTTIFTGEHQLKCSRNYSVKSRLMEPTGFAKEEHNSKPTTMKRHGSAREYCGNSNLLLQMHALLTDAQSLHV